MTHGWPGSVFELLKTVGPLTDPDGAWRTRGGRLRPRLPSMPGYGFSGKPTGTGWDPDRIARAWAELMKRLGYTRYVAQGGDWGSPVSSAMARQAPAGLLGIHINLPATVPPEMAAVLAGGGPAPAGLSEKERAAFDSLDTFYKKYRAYAAMMGTRPQTIGYALTDSPAGLAAWMYDYNNGEPERLLTKDEVLDDITLYWLTNTATSAARLYWETGGQSVLLAAAQKTAEISLPVAITVFPEEVYRAPETWARRAYRNLIYFNEVDKGGHFAAWEQPELFSAELRAAFRSLRPLIADQDRKEIHMKTTRIMAAAALIVASAFGAARRRRRRQPGIKRTDLLRHDLSVPGREVDPGARRVRRRAWRCSQAHAIRAKRSSMSSKACWSITLEGKPPVTLKAGEVAVHPGRNDPRGEERRQRQRGGARHVHRRKRKAAPRAGEVSAPRAAGAFASRHPTPRGD